MDLIEIKNLSKIYKKNPALKDVNLKLEKGKIYGLLGRNGAGKSTLLRCINKRIKVSSGTILYDGIEDLSDQTFMKIFLSEPDNLLDEDLKIKEIFEKAKILNPDFDLEKSQKDAEDFELKLNNKFKELSTGYQSITRAILALNSKADFIFLDEPTLGYDLVSRELFYKKLLEVYNKYQVSIILSTHLIGEISHLLEEVIFIKKGEILLAENTDNLLDKYVRYSGLASELDQIRDKLKVIKTEVQGPFENLICLNENEISIDGNITRSRLGLEELFVMLNSKE